MRINVESPQYGAVAILEVSEDLHAGLVEVAVVPDLGTRAVDAARRLGCQRLGSAEFHPPTLGEDRALASRSLPGFVRALRDDAARDRPARPVVA